MPVFYIFVGSYNSLITRQGVSGDDEAIISIYRPAGIEGVFRGRI